MIQREQKIKIEPIQNFGERPQIRQKQNKTKDLDCVSHFLGTPMRRTQLSLLLRSGAYPMILILVSVTL
jgi:hypothetical protein